MNSTGRLTIGAMALKRRRVGPGRSDLCDGSSTTSIRGGVSNRETV